MTTWQGTNGGLLAGIGGVNSNAPSVNDIGNTLQLIRQNNDIERSGANNVGLTALQGLSGIAGVFQQEKQAQRQKEFQQAYANAYASGDRGALRQLATQYPDQIESVRKGMGFIDEEQRNSIGTLAAGARLASSSPEAMQSWLQNNAKELTRVGVDPNSVAQMYQQNPSGFGEFVDHLGMAALGPIDYFNVQDKMAGREIDRGRLAETIRSNQAGEALTARGQNITMRGQDLSASTARRGQDLAMQRASTRRIAGNDERTEGRVFAEALPYLTPAGVERAATQAPTLAGRIAQGATRLLAENAVGSLAANSAKDDAEALATDLGVGVLAGGAINAAGRGLGAAYRGVRGAIAPEAQQAIRFAEREGVPLHTTDLLQPTSRVGKMAQTTAENIPLAGTSGMRATQQEARSQLVQRFADKFGEYDPSVVIDSLKAKTSGIRRAAGNRLEQVQNAMAGVNIQPARAIQQIDTEISNLQKLGKVADNETISKLQSYRDELVRNVGPDGPVNLDLKQLSDLRSQFRMDVKGERPVLPNSSDAAIQRVYKAMTDDINGAIGHNLGNDTLRKYQQANAVYADEAAKLKNTRLKNVLMKGDLTPEVVNNMLFSKNKSEIKTLYNSVGRVGRAQMRNGIIGKAMEKSGGSPDQFLRQLNILQNQTGITFKGQDAAYLKGLKNYLQSTQQAAKAAVTTPTGQQTIPFIIGYGTAMNPATTGAAVSYGLLTRAYESEPFRNAMLRMANTPRGSTAFEKAMQQAQKAINAMTQGAKSDALSE